MRSHENQAMENPEKAMVELTKRNEQLEDTFEKMENFLVSVMHSMETTLQLMQTNNMG